MKQHESNLQTRVQRLIESRGGYAQKNHGSMISEPGIADIFCCYKGLFIAIELKEKGNKPSKQQGIHCRLVRKAFGVSLVSWSVESVALLLDFIDKCILEYCSIQEMFERIESFYKEKGLDNGEKW